MSDFDKWLDIYLKDSWLGRGPLFTTSDIGTGPVEKSAKASLRATVELELAAIMADMADFNTAPPELPPPPPELTDTYAVAFASAVRRCTHRNSRSTMLARNEHQCDDCGRYFTKPLGLFG